MGQNKSYHSSVPEQENTHKNLQGPAQERVITEEMIPFAIYAAIPIIITIAIAYIFGVR